MLINSMEGILSQCVRISNCHVVNFKYLTILFVNYTSMKLKRKKNTHSNSIFRLSQTLATVPNLTNCRIYEPSPDPHDKTLWAILISSNETTGNHSQWHFYLYLYGKLTPKKSTDDFASVPLSKGKKKFTKIYCSDPR